MTDFLNKIIYIADTWDKARKIAHDPLYKTTDEENLGKGCRAKFVKTKYSSSPESSIDKKDFTTVKNKGRKKRKIQTYDRFKKDYNIPL